MNKFWGSAATGAIIGSLAIFLLNLWRINNEGKKNFRAALLIVIHELADNLATIRSYIDAYFDGESVKSFRLRDDAYQANRLVLTRGLDESIATPLSATYGMIIFTDQKTQQMGSPSSIDLDELEDATTDIQAQINSLVTILRDGNDSRFRDPSFSLISKLFLVWLKNRWEESWEEKD